MKRDTRLSGVLHALLHMAEHDRAPMTSDMLAHCMSTNPAVVRRTMAGLREAGIVTSVKGHGGGWSLARDLSQVTLRDVYAALGMTTVFCIGHRNGKPECLLEQVANEAMDDALARAESMLVGRLNEITVASLSVTFHQRAALLTKERSSHAV
ncbi:Rrf2 family protein [Luteibacter sp. Sphag1AF]|uniref:Rrf2 family transcriptional regulator n=1 Tax=Luteibacter sp. Sphag1AF TaxID=2587031 RepID=UPI0016076FA6|nr:Rrf2 family transcriptional regulator [Luteibacter sp. Sphag1AF]MBB3228657.1 Rrf2 family protein [Luteibacter sp. Sphag1AF]